MDFYYIKYFIQYNFSSYTPLKTMTNLQQKIKAWLLYKNVLQGIEELYHLGVSM